MKLLRKRYTLPKGMSCKNFVMRELNAKDEIEAAIMADKLRSELSDETIIAAMGAERHEAMRLSICSVDGEPVNQAGVPFMAMDGWTYKTMRLVMRAFNDMNGVDVDELEDFANGSVIVNENNEEVADPAEEKTTSSSEEEASPDE